MYRPSLPSPSCSSVLFRALRAQVLPVNMLVGFGLEVEYAPGITAMTWGDTVHVIGTLVPSSPLAGSKLLRVAICPAPEQADAPSTNNTLVLVVGDFTFDGCKLQAQLRYYAEVIPLQDGMHQRTGPINFPSYSYKFVFDPPTLDVLDDGALSTALLS